MVRPALGKALRWAFKGRQSVKPEMKHASPCLEDVLTHLD